MTDQQTPSAELGTVTQLEMQVEHLTAVNACIVALKQLSFPEAMVVLVNVFCRAAQSQGVPRETAMRLVSHVWDAMAALATAPKERA